MLVSLPEPPPAQGPFALYVQRLVATLRGLLTNVVSTQQAAPRIILRSPSGLSFDVTVTDAGVLQITQNAGHTPP
jgi:hypothetical protein